MSKNWNNTWGTIDWESEDTKYIMGSVCQLLINGADPNDSCSFDSTILKDIIENESIFPMSEEARRGVACALIAGGADVNYGNLLYEAVAANRDASIVKLLIAAGADINEGEYNKQPIDAALSLGNNETINLLSNKTIADSDEMQEIGSFLNGLKYDINHSYIGDASDKLIYFAKHGRPVVEMPVKVATHEDVTNDGDRQHE